MTDKQIIIDGSDCGYYNEGICWNDDVAIKHCAECNYCYHKTVKTLKEQLEAYKMEAEEGKEINAELKAENDELKKKCNIYTCGICGNKEDCNKLYKTLTEIKEIAEKSYRTPLAEKDCIKCDDFLEQILQKISECEEG